MNIPILLVAALLAHAPAVGRPVPIRATAGIPDIVRHTPGGPQRMVSLEIDNAGTTPLTGLALNYRVAGRPVARDLIDVRPGGGHDTLWVPADLTGGLAVRLTRAGETVWSGSLTLPEPAMRRVTIPRSKPVGTADLQPLTLRGANYYPRSQPWPGLWRAMDERAFEAEFAEMDGLCINAIRTFYNFDEERGLHTKDGAFTPDLVSRINTLLSVADRHHVKVMICLVGGGGAPMSDLAFWKRYIRTGVEPFAYDGRVLMWDLINEPGGNDGPKANPDLSCWLKALYPFVKQVDPNHLETVGLCWQFDQLWALGVRPDVGQYHDYSGAVGVQPKNGTPVRSVAADIHGIVRDYTGARPLVIGEFGLHSETGEEKTDAERTKAIDHQADTYRWVLEGADAERIAGTFNWIAFQFTPDWMGRKEQTFGVIRPDGSLKPAGVVLRDTYRRWRAQHRAPWEPPTR